MKFKNFSNYSYKYIYLSFSLIVSFWAISIFELIMTSSNGLEQTNLTALLGFKLLNDFGPDLGIGLLFSPLYLLFSSLKNP